MSQVDDVHLAYLSVENHVNTLILDIFRMLSHELKNMLDEGLIRKSSQTNAILASPGGNEVLRKRDGRKRLQHRSLKRLYVTDTI